MSASLIGTVRSKVHARYWLFKDNFYTEKVTNVWWMLVTFSVSGLWMARLGESGVRQRVNDLTESC